jgi:O-antigen/teichoic acid export membrane protein
MKRLLIGNFLLRLGVQFVERVAGLVIVPVLIVRIGVDGYGFYGLANGVILLFVNIICLRFTMAMIRFYPGTREKAGSVVVAGFSYWLLFALASIALVVAMPATLSSMAFAEPGKAPLLMLAVGAGLLTTFYEFLTATLRAENRLVLMSAVDAGERLLFIGACILALSLWRPSVEMVLGILCAGTALRIALLLRPSLRGLRLEVPSFSLFKAMLLFCLPFLPYLASVWLIERSPFFIVAREWGAESAGILMLAFTLASILAAVTIPLQTTLFPMLSRAYDDNRIEDVRAYMSIALRMTISFCAFGTLTLVIGTEPLLALLNIEEAAPPRLLGAAMCLAITLGAFRQLVINLLHVEKKTASLIWIAVAGAASAALAAVALLPKLGLVGAALAMALGTGTQVIGMMRRASLRLVEAPSAGYLLSVTASTLAALAIQVVALHGGHWVYVSGVAFSGLVFLLLHYLMGGLSSAEKLALAARFSSWHGERRT